MPNNLPVLEIDVEDPMVESIATDEQLLGLWGFLRLAAATMSLTDIVDGTGMDAAIVQRKLDVLVAYRIVEALPARTRRRGIGYRALHDGLRLRVPPSTNGKHVERIVAIMQAHKENLFTKSDGRNGGGYQANFSFILHMRPEEIEELRERLHRLAEYTRMLSEKYAARGQKPELCNFVFQCRMEELGKPMLPQAPVTIAVGGADSTADAPALNGRKRAKLSTRERQVAQALMRGRTLEEVGAELGIARNTAATMTKRIYAKLGVHRRAELVARLQEEFGDVGFTPPTSR